MVPVWVWVDETGLIGRYNRPRGAERACYQTETVSSGYYSPTVVYDLSTVCSYYLEPSGVIPSRRLLSPTVG